MEVQKNIQDLYAAIQEFQGKIEDNVVSKITPQITQLQDDVSRNVLATKNEMIVEVKTMRQEQKTISETQRNDQIVFLGELKNAVDQFKNSNESRLDSFEKRLIHVEGSMWSKWHLLAIYIIVILAMGLSIFVTTREHSLEKRDEKIELLFKRYFPNESTK